MAQNMKIKMPTVAAWAAVSQGILANTTRLWSSLPAGRASVVGRGELHHVHAAPVEIGNAAEDGVSLARGETARNRRAGAGRKGGIEAVDVEAQVCGAMPHPVADALDHAADAQRVERGGVED